MNLFERTLRALAPGLAAARARNRALVAHYDAASTGRRMGTLRPSRTDADAASARRAVIAFNARDAVRNTAFAARAKMVIGAAVVGDGIIPKVTVRAPARDSEAADRMRRRGLELVERHLDTVAIDYHGRANLYGLQRQIIEAVAVDGECLVRIHRRPDADGGLPLQIEVLEIDHLDDSRWGSSAAGGEVIDGIEYDAARRRVAYWLFPRHPGADSVVIPNAGVSEPVRAADVLHIYRPDRPGQQRGVSWLAPVLQRLQDLGDHEDAQLVRQKVAACFAAFRVTTSERAELPERIEAGMIYDVAEGEDVKFAAPPGVEAYDEFTASVLRSIAAGIGISYEALTGDLSRVNFSSARMGRVEMDANVSAWQWLMMVPQLLAPLAREFLDAWQRLDADEMATAGVPVELWGTVGMNWVPPRRFIVDPAREFVALREAVRAGFASRQQIVRELGIDPERLLEEIAQDKRDADRLGLPFDSDPRADVSRQSRSEDRSGSRTDARLPSPGADTPQTADRLN